MRSAGLLMVVRGGEWEERRASFSCPHRHMADKEGGWISPLMLMPSGLLTHTPAIRISSTVLPRHGAGPAAIGWSKASFSYSYDPGVIFSKCCIWRGVRGKAPLFLRYENIPDLDHWNISPMIFFY